MTPKEKAEELINEFWTLIGANQDALWIAKNCAAKCVDEIDEAIDFDWMEVQNLDSEHRFWEKVKQEIQNF
jgi:hypothetical protein